jgi:hypothetical protein
MAVDLDILVCTALGDDGVGVVRAEHWVTRR